MSVDQSSPPLSMELSTLEKALPSTNEPNNHRIPLTLNDQSRSLQELPVTVNAYAEPVGVKLKRYCRVVTMCVAVAVIWGVLTQPIIIYYLKQGQV